MKPKLTEKQSSGEQPLDGSYHIVVDLSLSADKRVTLADVERKVAELGGVKDFYIWPTQEVYASSPFNIGDTIELSAEYNCDKAVYMDTHGNLFISDRPVAEGAEKVGDFTINLPIGTTAEINNKPADGFIEVLFTGESIHLEALNKVAYLGILELPADCLKSI